MGQILKVKIVLDTNVILSALGWLGTPYKVLEEVFCGDVQNFTSPVLIQELKRKLTSPKLLFPLSTRSELVDVFLAESTLVHPKIVVDVLPNNDPDNRILECALEARADCTVTGDKPLQTLHPWGRIQILSPAKFLQSSLIG